MADKTANNQELLNSSNSNSNSSNSNSRLDSNSNSNQKKRGEGGRPRRGKQPQQQQQHSGNPDSSFGGRGNKNGRGRGSSRGRSGRGRGGRNGNGDEGSRRGRGRGHQHHQQHQPSPSSIKSGDFVDDDLAYMRFLESTSQMPQDLGLGLSPSNNSNKKGVSINHLLDFKPRKRQQPKVTYSSSSTKKSASRSGLSTIYNREQYMQANCQFHVKAGRDYSKFISSPDKMVDWDDVEQVVVSCTQDQKCPICLGFPVAAKITRCGHVYCWNCLLHHLSTAPAEAKYQTCAICEDYVYVKDLRSVMWHMVTPPKIDRKFRLSLLKRNKGTTMSIKAEQWSRAQPLSPYETFVSRQLDKSFFKIIPYGPSDIEEMYARERRELMVAVDECGPAVDPFLLKALAILDKQIELFANMPAVLKQSLVFDGDEGQSRRVGHPLQQGHPIQQHAEQEDEWRLPFPNERHRTQSTTSQVSVTSAASDDFDNSEFPVLHQWVMHDVDTESKVAKHVTAQSHAHAHPKNSTAVMTNTASDVDEDWGPQTEDQVSTLKVSEEVEKKDENLIKEAPRVKEILGSTGGASLSATSKAFMPSAVTPSSSSSTVSNTRNTTSISNSSSSILESSSAVTTNTATAITNNNDNNNNNNNNTNANTNTANSSSTESTYAYLQASDGQFAFIHSLNLRCLIKEYGSIDNCPPTVEAPVIEITRETMTRDLRSRFRYLAHLPLSCEFLIMELDLKEIVSPSTLAHFSKDIGAKRAARKKKVQQETNYSRKMQQQLQHQQTMFFSQASTTASPSDTMSDSVLEWLSLGHDQSNEIAKSHHPEPPHAFSQAVNGGFNAVNMFSNDDFTPLSASTKMPSSSSTSSSSTTPPTTTTTTTTTAMSIPTTPSNTTTTTTPHWGAQQSLSTSTWGSPSTSSLKVKAKERTTEREEYEPPSRNDSFLAGVDGALNEGQVFSPFSKNKKKKKIVLLSTSSQNRY